MENVEELYNIEHMAPDDYTGPKKHEVEFIIGPVANRGLNKMHAAMHTAIHVHMGRGHHDRHCCDPIRDPGIRMRSRSLRDSLVYGTRKVRSKGLKVDDSLRLVQLKMRSRSIRDSLVYGTRTKRCRHKQCTAWDHQHEWNEVVEKWDIPFSMLKNEKKRSTWFGARKSVLDQESIRRKSIPRSWFGELETEAGFYCGYLLRALLPPWNEGFHKTDLLRYSRGLEVTDWIWDRYYDERPDALEYHKKKLKELADWQIWRNLRGDMRYMFDRVSEARRQRRHFQRLKNRLKKKVMLWTELNRNSLWFMPWPEGDQQPEMIRRSLMAISKRLSTCAPMWHPNFTDLGACEYYLHHLDEMAPKVWEQFHYNCRLHKHLDHHEKRKTILAAIAAANAPPVQGVQKIVQPPLCEPVQALEGFRKEWAAMEAAKPSPVVVTEPAKPPALPVKGKTGPPSKPAEQPPATKGKKGEPVQSVHPPPVTKPNSDEPGSPKSNELVKPPSTKSKKREAAAVPPTSLDTKSKNEETSVKRKKSSLVLLPPPKLPPQLVFLKRGQGRQSVCRPAATNGDASEEPDAYVPFKFPIRKRKYRWSIIGGKVPLVDPVTRRLSPASAKAALDLLELDAFDARLEATRRKVPDKKGVKKGKDAKSSKDSKDAVGPKKK